MLLQRIIIEWVLHLLNPVALYYAWYIHQFYYNLELFLKVLSKFWIFIYLSSLHYDINILKTFLFLIPHSHVPLVYLVLSSLVKKASDSNLMTNITYF